MMFKNLLFAALALVVFAFGMEPDKYDSPDKATQHAALSSVPVGPYRA